MSQLGSISGTSLTGSPSVAESREIAVQALVDVILTGTGGSQVEEEVAALTEFAKTKGEAKSPPIRDILPKVIRGLNVMLMNSGKMRFEVVNDLSFAEDAIKKANTDSVADLFIECEPSLMTCRLSAAGYVETQIQEEILRYINALVERQKKDVIQSDLVDTAIVAAEIPEGDKEGFRKLWMAMKPTWNTKLCIDFLLLLELKRAERNAETLANQPVEQNVAGGEEPKSTKKTKTTLKARIARHLRSWANKS
ncbi:hypothetical protein C8R47DRAFT_1315611 [Mycena vitilis]|nr:hypothetical protein C8R47DRAFT_1315611 [Mycena vitilis]